MPQRQTVKRIDASSVQGEGAYAIVRALKYGEARAARAAQGEGADALQQAGEKLIIGRVIEWNWVDDEGSPLPQPKEHPEVLDDLTIDEIKFLTEQISGDPNAASG